MVCMSCHAVSHVLMDDFRFDFVEIQLHWNDRFKMKIGNGLLILPTV